jgi:signal transduction histidine kinase/DNA-binding transcriptional regulator YiaG
MATPTWWTRSGAIQQDNRLFKNKAGKHIMKKKLDLKAIGARIKEGRTNAGQSQKQLADLVGCDHSYVSQVEKGKNRPSLDFLAAFSKLSGQTIDYLLFGKRDQAQQSVIMNDATSDKDLLQMMENIESVGNKLADMVEKFLYASRNKTHKMDLHPGRVELPSFLERLRSGFLALAEKKRISLESEIPSLNMFSLDRRYMDRAVTNLLQNAINHTPAGGKVVLKAEVGQREAGGRRSQDSFLAISVQDTGSGITEEDKDKIFDQYYGTDRNTGIKGTGLGLAMVKVVAEAHGGRVAVESERGKGTTFRMYLPGELQIKEAPCLDANISGPV